MAAPVIASEGANSNGTGTTVNIGAPGSISVGDLLITVMDSDTAANTFSPPGGNGWALLHRNNISTAGVMEVYWKIANGSDSFAFTQSSAKPWAAKAIRITGHDATTPIPQSDKSGNTSAVTSLKTAVITTTRDECLVISFFSEDGDASGVGWSSAGATEFFNFQEATGFNELAGYSETKSPAGEISRTALLASANECDSVILAVQPPLSDKLLAMVV